MMAAPEEAAAMQGSSASNKDDGSGRIPSPVTICVGDLHGHLDRAKRLWANLEARVGRAQFESATVVFLGDYCDRGPDTKGLLDWLLSLKSAHPRQRQVFLAGNHDFSFAAFTGCLPPAPPAFDFSSTWSFFSPEEQEAEGWYSGPAHDTMHAQGRRWAGLIKKKVSKKNRPYDKSTFDSGATFRSYGVEFGDREAMLQAMPQEHKDFLRSLVWVYEQEEEQEEQQKHTPGGGGRVGGGYRKLIAVHAGLERGHGAEEQLARLRRREPTLSRFEELSGRSNVYDNLPELEEANVLVVSGHHGVLDTDKPLRLIIDAGGGLDLPIAAVILPSRELVWDTGSEVQLKVPPGSAAKTLETVQV